MGAISGHIVLLALFSVRFLAKSKRAGSLWPFGSTKRYLKEAPRRTPSSRHIQYFCGHEAFSISAPCASSEFVHFRHRIGEEGVELILKESIRTNLAMEDRKKEEDDRNKGKTVVDARATIVWDVTSTRFQIEFCFQCFVHITKCCQGNYKSFFYLMLFRLSNFRYSQFYCRS